MPLLAESDVAAALVRHARFAHRLRLEVVGLIGDPELGRRIEASVARRHGVTRVRANPRSGRVLVELEPGAEIVRDLERLARTEVHRAEHGRAPALAIGDPHARDAAAVVAALGSSERDGLVPALAAQRLAQLGPNLLEREAPPSRLALLANQLATLPTALLLGSAAISVILGDVIDASAIVFVVGLNAAIGYRMERRSEELLASWRLAEVGEAEVIRGGTLETVHAAELVPGDLLVLRAGNVIPADARVLEAHRLAVDEAPLTGESEPVAKSARPVAAAAPLAERSSMLYRGTVVATGHGHAVVTATGPQTELANVQRLAAASHGPKARLQQRLDALAGRLASSAIGAAGISAIASLAWRRPLLDVVRDTVALGVAAIPEGLPVTATAALVHAMARMRTQRIVVRRLGTTEALGGVTVACADKTGTLTENRMRLELAWLDGHRVPREALATGARADGPIAALLAAALLNSDLDYHANGNGLMHLTGSSTELALARAAEAAGLDYGTLRARYPRRALIERTAEEHYVISEHVGPDGEPIEFVKGAPEQVVELCELGDGAARVLAENERLASEGLRVLAVGWRWGRARSWRLLGLVALRDPLREGSAAAVQAAARAGIRTVMLTGDQRATAAAIAREVGLAGEVIDGSELPALLAAPDAAARLAHIAGIARVTPGDKVAVVRALRAAGEIVAMAGDGINDAPALKAADVGIAVGARSTDLARQTADVVLEQADLRSILAAVAEGRIVQDNLRRAIRFQIAGNLGELMYVVGGSLAGRRVISPLGVLWINLLTDTLPGLALSLEAGDPRVLDRAPAPPGAPILDRADWRRVARDGAAIAGGAAAAAIAAGPLAGFAVIGAGQFGYAAACRAPERTPEGPRFALLVGGSAALHLAAVATQPMRSLLRMGGPSPAAIGAFAIALAAPLYLAWRKRAGYLVIRRNPEST